MDDELEALRWLTVYELAAARRRAIKAWNLLDRTAPDYARQQAELQRQLLKIRLVQDERRSRHALFEHTFEHVGSWPDVEESPSRD